MVGALIVSPDGVVVGRGFHERAGTPHAEIHAIADAGERARGATLYCTLEPCCHTGRTGPCSVAVQQARASRAWWRRSTDPNPRVAGGGIRYLREHGIDVTVGVLGDRAARLNDVFFTNVTKRRPFVTLKIAMSLDGRIAAAPGARTALTSAAANRHAQRLRAEVDAIAVGSETVLADDPLLTARDVYRWRPLDARHLRQSPAHAADGAHVRDARRRTDHHRHLEACRAGEIVRIDQPPARARRRGRDDRRDGDGARSDERDDASLRGSRHRFPAARRRRGAARRGVERGARRSRADVCHAACARAGRRAVGHAVVVRLDDAARHAE